jgi:hypothetical protein
MNAGATDETQKIATRITAQKLGFLPVMQVPFAKILEMTLAVKRTLSV